MGLSLRPVREAVHVEIEEFRRGLRNAVSVYRVGPLFLRSSRVRRLAFQCFLLNGVIFLGSLLCFDYVARPTIKFFADSSNSDRFALLEPLVDLFVRVLFNFLWIVPAYAISFVLNAVWYQEIADIAFTLKDPEGKHAQINFVSLIAEELYRIPLMVVVLLEAQIVGFVLGSAIALTMLTWVYAYYCFEYKWTLQGWSLQRRLREIETRWAFYAGFGAPPTLATYFFPTFVSAGIFALIFPLFILTAMESDVPTRDSGLRLPIFDRSKVAVNLLLRLGPCRRFGQNAGRERGPAHRGEGAKSTRTQQAR